MICAQCGATSDEGQRFCYNCGARLVAQAPQVAAPPIEGMPLPPPPAPIQPAGYQQPYPGQYQQPGVYQAPVGYAPQVIPNSPLAITSLVAGILAWVVLPFVSAVIAVITGHMARGEIRRAGGRFTGEGMALVGLVLGYTQIVLMVLGACFFLFVIAVAS